MVYGEKKDCGRCNERLEISLCRYEMEGGKKTGNSLRTKGEKVALAALKRGYANLYGISEFYLFPWVWGGVFFFFLNFFPFTSPDKHFD